MRKWAQQSPLLQHVAEQLRRGTRSGDTVCRQSGDEFLVVLGDIADVDAVADIATQLLELLALPLDIEGIEVSATCSLGIALYPVDGEDFDTLLKKADLAMYRAKESGRNNFRFYDAQMNTSVLEHLQLITAMRLGFSRGEFSLLYQAQYDLRSGRVVGAEALLRWQHPQLGQVSTAVFIPLAEKSGLIIELGAWVLQQACAQAAQWHAEGLSLVVAVNLSPLQMRRHDIDQVVVMLLVGVLVARDAVLEGVALDRALRLQHLHRPVDGRERQRRIMREGAGEDALGVRMVVGFGEHAQDQPALLRHAQPGSLQLALENGNAPVGFGHALP